MTSLYSTSAPKNAGHIATMAIAVFTLFMLLLGVYVGASLGLARLSDWSDAKTGEVTLLRYYSQPWQVIAFGPAGRAEEALRRTNVMVELWVEP